METVQRRQTLAPHCNGTLCLSGLSTSVLSPYFQRQTTRKEALDRDTNLILESMIKTFWVGWTSTTSGLCAYIEMVDNVGSNNYSLSIPVTPTATSSQSDLETQVYPNLLQHCDDNSIPYPDVFVKGFATPLDVPSAPVASVLSLSLQTGTGAVGTQVSSTQNAYVMINGSVSTTASIGGNAGGDIILEVAPTNSATAGDWVEWGRIGNSQALTLALALGSVQVVKGEAMAFVPAGYYVKARTLTSAGSPTYTLTNAKKILI